METKVKINYDTAFGEDDEMSQTDVHNNLIIYLMEVLSQLFAGQNVGIFTSIQLYGDPLYPSRNKSPDVLVIDNLMSTPDGEIASYYINDSHPPPRVLMEISSKDNWNEDVEQIYKVGSYERMGIPEYFACDPHPVQVWKNQWQQRGRLVGWRFDPTIRRFASIEPDEGGRLWSEGLQSWLVMEGHQNRQLHLYDSQGNLRLTPAEAERQQVLVERQRAETQQQRATAEQQLRMVAQERVRELEDLLRQLQNKQNDD